MTILGSFKGFALEGVAFLVIGYIFYFAYTTYYPQYADNWLYLGILGLAYILVSAFSLKMVTRFGR